MSQRMKKQRIYQEEGKIITVLNKVQDFNKINKIIREILKEETKTDLRIMIISPKMKDLITGKIREIT